MMQYKSIPFIARITQKDGSATVAVQVQAMIDVQASEGWTFVRIEQTKTLVASQKGCFGLNDLPAYMKRNAIVIFERPDVYTPQAAAIAATTQSIPIVPEGISIITTNTAPPIVLTKKTNTAPAPVVTPVIATNITINNTADNQQRLWGMVVAGFLLLILLVALVPKCSKDKTDEAIAAAEQAQADAEVAARAADVQDNKHHETPVVPATTDNSNFNTDSNGVIGTILTNYYNACAQGNATTILSYWSDSPEKYYNLKGEITKAVIEAEIYKDPCKSKSAQVIDASSIIKTGDDVYFDLHYTCERQPPKKSVDRNLRIHIKMNSDNKIYSIEEL